MKKNINRSIYRKTAGLLAAILVVSAIPSASVSAAKLHLVWKMENGAWFWYENGTKQGTYDDPKGVMGDKTIRGREIYDPETKGWYWLDAIYGGAKACNKEVWMPYIYQDEAEWDDDKIAENATVSGDMAEQVQRAMLAAKNGETDSAIIGKWVRYDASGKMIKEWYTVEGEDAKLYPTQAGNTYYYDPKTGLMAKGTVTINGKKYTFDETTGALKKGQNTENGEIFSMGIGVERHSREEIERYMASSGASLENETTMQEDISLTTPYAAGVISEKSLEDALAMLNQIRYIAGLNHNVTLNEQYAKMAQTAALVNAANNALSHYPDKPAGMDEDLYKLGASGAASSNLAYTSWKTSLSYSLLKGWMDDSDPANINMVGHRRWILSPSMELTGFGFASSGNGNYNAPTYSSMYVFDSSIYSDIAGVAWPAMEMPISYFENDVAWSYSYGKALSDVRVKLECQNASTPNVWNFSNEEKDGFFNVNNDGYGQPGCVIFRPNEIDIHAGDCYLVTIWESDSIIAQYTVNFF